MNSTSFGFTLVNNNVFVTKVPLHSTEFFLSSYVFYFIFENGGGRLLFYRHVNSYVTILERLLA
jgi:hypothetical protein